MTNAIRISDRRITMLALKLPTPFRTAFGELDELNRVVIELWGDHKRGRFHAIGEASIDFPFSPYDTWDIYYALANADLHGQVFHNRREFFYGFIADDDGLAACPAAQCAMNQALDQLEAQASGIPLVDLYGRVRHTGSIMESLGIPDNPQTLKRKVLRVIACGRTPKLKLGVDLDHDICLLDALEEFARLFGFEYALDFNAGYRLAQFENLLDAVCKRHVPRHAIIWEQPLKRREGVAGLRQALETLRNVGVSANVVADESFLTMEDGLECAASGIGLNYKLQKIGGMLLARRIEAAVRAECGQCPPCLVGGTFPTAIGRHYDRVAALSLRSIRLPSDGLLPAQTYFRGEADIAPIRPLAGVVDEEVLPSPGLSWDGPRVRAVAVEDPRRSLAQIRLGLGHRLDPENHPLLDYPSLYFRVTGKPIWWNLPEAKHGLGHH